MTVREFINTLFKISADQMGLPYIKCNTERLQEWSIDSNNKTFIAFLDIDNSTTISFSQANTSTLNLTLVACVETLNVNPENNYTNEEVEYYKGEVSEIINRFVYFVSRNDNINSMTVDVSEDEVFKDPRFLGIGLGFTMNVEVSDVQDYCFDFDNNQTKTINLH